MHIWPLSKENKSHHRRNREHISWNVLNESITEDKNGDFHTSSNIDPVSHSLGLHSADEVTVDC